MVIVKVLKRKDASALVVGVSVALIVTSFLTTATTQLVSKISNIGLGSSAPVEAGWRSSYFMPFVALILQLLALEILTRIYIMLHDSMQK